MPTFLRRIGDDTRYLLLGFPLSVIAFSLLVTGFAAGVGTAVIVVGLLVLAVTLRVARGFAMVERRWLPMVLRRPVAEPRYLQPPDGTGWFRRAVNPLSCGQSWLDLLHTIAKFPIAIIGFVVALTWWVGAVSGLLYPIVGWALYRALPESHNGLPQLLGLGDSLTVAIGFYLALSALFAVTLPFVLRGTALCTAALGEVMLIGAARPHERVDGPYERPEYYAVPQPARW